MEVGKIYNNFKLINKKEISDVSSTLYEFEHLKTKGKLVYLENDDINKCFAYGFRTVPHDSTGVCHIIEHSVLCGSKKYPLKEPFVNLLKTSMATFLNAMTADDWTVYPVASCNDKDFQNLMDIYLDAVFNPLSIKDKKPFLQEGWHLHLENKDDVPYYKGVVYNEMKGATSSVDEQLAALTNANLYKGSSYQYNSGGDPKDIPNLTYQDYKRFYKKHYNPSNGIAYLYGKMDILEKLKYIDENYLCHYEYKKPVVIRPVKKNINKDVKDLYAITKDESEEKNSYYSLAFGLDKYDNNIDFVGMNILNEVLMGSNDAPLKKAILDAGLGEDFYSFIFEASINPSIHLELSKAEKGIKDKFYNVVMDTLKDIVKKKVSKEDLIATININLFKNKEMDSGRMPKGLFFLFSILQCFNYNIPVEKGLEYSQIYDYLRKEIDNGYFEKLIKKYFLNSKHFVLVELDPSKTKGEEEQMAMQEKMQEIKNNMSDDEIEKLVKETKKLLKYQSHVDTKEELATLPKLKKSDLDENVIFLEAKEENINGIKYLIHDLKTNGIAYLKMYFEGKTLNMQEVPYFKLLSRLYAELDTKNYKANDLQSMIKANLGSFDYALLTGGNNKDEVIFKGAFYVSALEENISYMSKVFNEVTYNTIFDHDKIKIILNQMKIGLRNQIIEAGNSVAGSMVSARLSLSGALNSRKDGIYMYDFVSKLIDNYDEKEIEKQFKTITQKIFNKNNLVISVTGDEKIIKNLINETAKFVLNEEKFDDSLSVKLDDSKTNGITIPSQVNYNAIGLNIYDLGLKPTGQMVVLNHILRYDYLWNQIRVKGGAYGTAISINKAGDLLLTTYRDPNVKRSYKIFKDVTKYLAKLNLSAEDLMDYVIGAVGKNDSPMSINSLVFTSDSNYLSGITKAELMERKRQMISTELKDLKQLQEIFAKLNNKNIFTVGNENIMKDEPKLKNIRGL